jgi:hypothetical protein
LAQSERGQRIDGTSLASFETSVVALQNDLSPRRREEFEVALAVIWIRNTLGSSDLDWDGDVDSDDGRALRDDADELLTDIQRGDIVAAIEAREANDYTAEDYFGELDGLGLDAVLEIAGRPTDDPYFAAMRRYRSEQGRCGRREQSIVRLKWCAQVSSSARGALNAAFEAVNAQRYAEARSVLETLKLDRLSPSDLSIAEQLLSSISYAEQKFPEARAHLQNAIVAGGLNEQEAAEALRRIRDIDSRLAQ